VAGVGAESEVLTVEALGRALLARQGLLERLDSPLVSAVEAVGAIQAQHWPAVPVALWTRIAGFVPQDLYEALERGDLVSGTLLRTTLHLVSAREHPAYAAVVAAVGGDDWRRTDAEASPEVGALRRELLSYTREEPRSGKEIGEFIEGWVAAHPDAIDPAELEHQRKYGWRPFLRWTAFVRAPADSRWGTKAPAAFRAAPAASERSDGHEVLDVVVRRHLRAFGPAGPDDVASWIGWRAPPVRDALERLEPELVRFEGEDGRPLYDLPEAPRPDPRTPAPPRLLAAFDSVLLAYASKRRTRILPDAYRDAVYERANLRIRPSFLVDGLVAGTWSVEVRRREATLTLSPFARLTKKDRAALVQEAERLVRAVQPDAKSHSIVVER
jgi:Winged helix DNA-binding domain